MEQTRGVFCTCESVVTRCNTQNSNEFDVRSVLHGQVSLAADNPIYVFHEVTNVCKNLSFIKGLR